MITLDVESYCHDCYDFEPVVERVYTDGDVLTQTVTCEGIGRCRAILEHVRQHYNQELKGEDNGT